MHTGATLNSVLVGRKIELGRLMRLLARDRDALPSALVEGEAGIGKTRLVSEVLGLAEDSGFRVARGACYENRAAGPYFPWMEILRQIGPDWTDPDDLAHAPTHSSVNGPTGLPLPAKPRGSRAQVLRSLTNALIERAASQPTIVCVEDLHLADVGSLLLLNSLLDLAHPALRIVCTARSEEEVSPEAAQLLAGVRGRTLRVPLSGLSLDDTRDLIDALLGGGRMRDDEAAALWLYTRGNPLFLSELLRYFQESRWLEKDTVTGALRRAMTPRSLAETIDSRLRCVPEPTLRLLAAAAVAGEEFSIELIACAAALPEEAVEAALEPAVRARLVEPEHVPGLRLWKFTHSLVAVRLYETLGQAERRLCHRRIARAAHGSNLLPLEDTAHHFALGYGRRRGSLAVGLCQAAAERADRLAAYETAARFWELAVACTPRADHGTRANLLHRLGWSLWAGSKWTAAAKPWKEAVALFQSLADAERVGELALALGEMYRWKQELPQAEQWLQLALNELQDSQLRARALALMGSLLCLRDQIGAGLEALREGSRLAERNGGDPIVGYWLAYGHLLAGHRRKAYTIAKNAFRDAERLDSPEALALLAGSMVHHELANMNLRRAREYVQVLQQHAYDPTQSHVLINLFVGQTLVEACVGNWKEVVRLSESWLPQLRLAGAYHVATVRVVLAEAHLALGDPATAHEELLQALPDLEQMRPVAELHLARVLHYLGQDGEAAQMVRRVAASVLDRPRLAKALLGDVVSRLPTQDLWEPSYAALLKEARPMVAVYIPINVQRVLGRLATRLRQWTQAAEHFDKAVGQLERSGARWGLAQTYLDYAELWGTRRRRGDATRAAALECKADSILHEIGVARPASEAVVSRNGNSFALTGRELEVLALVAQGYRNPEIANVLTISQRTVERHLENIFAKIGARSRTEAVMRAVEHRLIPSFDAPQRRDGAVQDAAN
ncbi:MAG: AAA family ATPase [Dehalococcoidia bacterium]